jgi:hypothetical protein
LSAAGRFHPECIVALRAGQPWLSSTRCTILNPSHKGIDLHTSHFIGATGEVGDPDNFINPPPPPHSRATGTVFVHYLEDGLSKKTHVRFWFPEDSSSRVMPVDFEIMIPIASWLKDKPLALTPAVVVKLICMVFFQEFTNDYYGRRIDSVSFQDLGTGQIIEVPYPKTPISKHEIALAA